MKLARSPEPRKRPERDELALLGEHSVRKRTFMLVNSGVPPRPHSARSLPLTTLPYVDIQVPHAL